MSPRWNWDSPTPLAASECALPPGPKGGGAHSPAAKGAKQVLLFHNASFLWVHRTDLRWQAIGRKNPRNMKFSFREKYEKYSDTEWSMLE